MVYFFSPSVFNDNGVFVVILHHEITVQRINSLVRCTLQTRPSNNISLNNRTRENSIRHLYILHRYAVVFGQSCFFLSRVYYRFRTVVISWDHMTIYMVTNGTCLINCDLPRFRPFSVIFFGLNASLSPVQLLLFSTSNRRNLRKLKQIEVWPYIVTIYSVHSTGKLVHTRHVDVTNLSVKVACFVPHQKRCCSFLFDEKLCCNLL